MSPAAAPPAPAHAEAPAPAVGAQVVRPPVHAPRSRRRLHIALALLGSTALALGAAEAALRVRERLLLRAAAPAHWSGDYLAYLKVSHASDRLFEHPAERILGQPLREFLVDHALFIDWVPGKVYAVATMCRKSCSADVRKSYDRESNTQSAQCAKTT